MLLSAMPLIVTAYCFHQRTFRSLLLLAPFPAPCDRQNYHYFRYLSKTIIFLVEPEKLISSPRCWSEGSKKGRDDNEPRVHSVRWKRKRDQQARSSLLIYSWCCAHSLCWCLTRWTVNVMKQSSVFVPSQSRSNYYFSHDKTNCYHQHT